MGGIVNSIFGGGGGGSGGSGGSQQAAPQQTTSNVYQTNIPDYAQPYVENMLNATQAQLFNTDSSGNITGFNQYQPYTGMTQDQLTAAQSAVAGFSPLQQQAQSSAANLQVPGQYGAATGQTMRGIMGANQIGGQMQGLAASANPYDFQQQVGGYMNPYIQQSLAPQLQLANQQYGIAGQQMAGQATGAGAFGGSRNALQQSLNAQNQMLAQNQLISQGYNTAFNAAQNQYNQQGQFQLNANQAALGALGQQGAMGAQLAGLGGQQLQAQQGILNAQNQVGVAQQAQQQQIINQAMQDYANAQQYPLMELGTMSNMLRGLPMQASTTNQYVAAPNQVTQGIGLAGAGASILNATKKAGGVIKEKKMAGGGIASYYEGDVVDSTENNLYEMPIDDLQKELKSPSQKIRQMVQRIMAERQMAGVQKAGGGIIAFASGSEDAIKEDPAAVAKAYRDAAVMNSFKQEPEPYVDRSIVQAAPALTRDDVRASEDRIANKVTEDPAMVRQAQIDAALLQSGNQNMPKNLQFTPGVTDRAQFMNPDSAAAKAITNKNLAGTGLNMDDEIAKQLLNRQLAESSAQRKGPQAKTFADLPPDQQKAFFAALEGKTNPKSIVAAAPPSVSSGNPTGAVAGANGTFNAADPANANKNVAINPNASAPAAAPPARLGINNVPPSGPAGGTQSGRGITNPNELLPTSGIKGGNAPFGIQAPADADANKSIQDMIAEKEAYMGPNLGVQKERANLMAEKANAADEARRTTALRMAEFFGAWGSTPGNTIVAGLNALKNKVPDFIADMKDASKVRRQIDKDIAELDKVERLEKSGNWEEAAKRRADLGKNALTKYGYDLKAAVDIYQANTQRDVGMAKVGGDKEFLRWQKTEALRANIDKAADQIRTKNKELYDTANMPLTADASDQMKQIKSNAQSRVDALERDIKERRDRTFNTKYNPESDDAVKDATDVVDFSKLPSAKK